MDLLAKIKKVDWQYLVNRREALLFLSITGNAKHFRKLTGIPWQKNLRLHLSDGDVFYSAKDLNKLRAIFLRGGAKLISHFRRRLIFYVKSFDNIARGIEKINCSKLTKNQLVNLLNKYVKAALYAHNFLSPMPIADGVLSKLILDLLPDAEEKKKQEWLGILSFPIKENEDTKEKRSFYKLASAHKNKNFGYLLGVHLKKYSWIGARWYWWDKEWKERDIKNQLENFFAQGKNPETELGHLGRLKKERVTATENLLKELNIKKSSELCKLILLAKEYAYLRPWRTNILYRAGYRVRGLFYEIAKRAGFKKDDVVYLTFEEIIKMARTEKLPVSPKEILKRKEFFVSISVKREYLVLSGKEWQKKLEAILVKKQKALDEIKGSIAFQGKAMGKVKIVFTTEDIKKVKRGDILVAVMTFPHFISAMEKAAAFVTDEGGILCHAAIVSREMNKPCIIGTKIATKVLKDGDLVEVDANKGIIRKIK